MRRDKGELPVRSGLNTVGRRLGGISALCALSVIFTWGAMRLGWSERLLPYQLPVMLAGYVLPMNWAVACAVIGPVLDTILLGFPEAMVMLPLVACQMIALAAFTNFLYTMLEMNPFGVYLPSVAFSYVILFCAAAIYGAVSRHAIDPLAYVRDTFLFTWPGLLLELCAPAVVVALRFARPNPGSPSE